MAGGRLQRHDHGREQPAPVRRMRGFGLVGRESCEVMAMTAMLMLIALTGVRLLGLLLVARMRAGLTGGLFDANHCFSRMRRRASTERKHGECTEQQDKESRH